MLQRLPLTALRFRSPALRALVVIPEGRTRISSALSNITTPPASFTSSCRTFSSSSSKDSMVTQTVASSPKRSKKKKKAGRNFVPLKAPVEMTETARQFFKALLDGKTNVAGIMLNYHQSSTGEPRMVFSFDFATEVGPDDEGASLEVLADGVTPKPPVESMTDGLPKLYIHQNAFMKVLGGKVDVDLETMKLTIHDKEGNVMDPNNT
mmetsp:Transcript_20817/g.34410  ORF Transcript_20817/g.34410 Transcript_20817/m.34410 type:complete len:208 (+) Transcript_20817:148-771(+)